MISAGKDSSFLGVTMAHRRILTKECGFIVIAACIVIAVCMAAGCTSYSSTKAGGFGAAEQNASGSITGIGDGEKPATGNTNANGGVGPGSDSSSSGGDSANAKSGTNGKSKGSDASTAKVLFRLSCSSTRVHDDGGLTDTTTVKFNQEVPILTDADAITEASENPYLFFSNDGNGGYGAKLPVSARWDHVCEQEGPGCQSFHYTYDGPIWISATLMHQPGHAPNEWSVQFSDVTTTSALDDAGHPDQYSKFAGGSSDDNTPAMKSLMTTMATTEAGGCWGGGLHPIIYSDGSQVTFTTDDPEVTLDSQAVMHFGMAP